MTDREDERELIEFQRQMAMRGEPLVAPCPRCGFESAEALREWSCPRCGGFWGAEGSREPVDRKPGDAR